MMLPLLTDSISYNFGTDGGAIIYTYPEDRQPETKTDMIALGFSTTQKDAVLVRINSHMSDDYLEMELVRPVAKSQFYGTSRNVNASRTLLNFCCENYTQFAQLNFQISSAMVAQAKLTHDFVELRTSEHCMTDTF